jgi:hypothetical protein
MLAPRPAARGPIRPAPEARIADDTDPSFANPWRHATCFAESAGGVTHDIMDDMDRQLASHFVKATCGKRVGKCRDRRVTDGIARQRTLADPEATARWQPTWPPVPLRPDGAKVRRALARPQSWTYPGRAHEQLAALPVAAELREAAVQVEGARRRPGATAGEGPGPAARRGVVLLAPVVLSLAGPAGTAALSLVRGVPGGVWRASSLAEGISSVLRVQQARHRKVTPGQLGLKRLYWNCHRFRTGKRRRRGPAGTATRW